MNGGVSPAPPAVLLGAVPDGLRADLVAAYSEVVRNYRERRWEPSELNGGKLCEVVYTIIRGFADGSFPPRASKPANMVDACRGMEQVDSGRFPRSIRVQIPRMLMALYEVRNNRGVGHVGGDVEPNGMDAAVVLAIAKWLMAEVIRLFHQVDAATAALAVDRVVERSVPLVWAVDGENRVLDPGLSMLDRALLLLYHADGPVDERDLVRWAEHSNPAVFRRDVLVKAHARKLLEYDRTAGRVTLSPVGVREVEERILSAGAS